MNLRLLGYLRSYKAIRALIIYRYLYEIYKNYQETLYQSESSFFDLAAWDNQNTQKIEQGGDTTKQKTATGVENFSPENSPGLEQPESPNCIGLEDVFFNDLRPINLFYFRARYYDPIMGRFLSVDPMGYKDSMNLYQAFNMNPMNFIDPLGLVTVFRAGQGPIGTVNIESGNKIVDYTILNLLNSLLNLLGFTINTASGALEFVDNQAWNGADWLASKTGLIKRGEWRDDYQFRMLIDAYLLANANTIAKRTKKLVDKANNILCRVIRSISSKKPGILNDPTKTVSFYVRSNGEVIPGTGYRYISSEAPYLDDLIKTGKIPENAKGTYLSFDNINFANEASDVLQVPHDAVIKIEFDVIEILDDVRIPKGKWNTANYLEPITKDFPKFGRGGVTQAITNLPIRVRKVTNLKTGKVLYEAK